MSYRRARWHFRRVDKNDGEAEHSHPSRVSSNTTASPTRKNILLCALFLTVPMLIFTAVMIGLVYRYKVPGTTTSMDPALAIPGTDPEAGVYYIRLSSTVLVFIASWSSSLAPLLSGVAMYLVAYPVAKQFQHDFQNPKPDNMPTPKQFALMLRFLDGSAGASLWSWWTYLSTWRLKRTHQSPSLTFPAFVTVLFFLLSFFVFLADTWLHVTTTSVNLAQFSVLNELPNYSLSLNPAPACASINGSLAAACSKDAQLAECSVACPAYGPAFVGGTISSQVIGNVSDSMAVYSNAPDPEFAYVGIPDSSRQLDLDYTATTFGAKTYCRPISSECNLQAPAGVTTKFWCSDAWQGNLRYDPLDVVWFTDQSLQDNFTYRGIENPFYYGIAASLSAAGTRNQETLVDSGEAVTPEHGGIAFVILCQTTMYDVEYDFVNNSVTRFVSVVSNSTVANWWQSIPSDTTFDITPYVSPILNLAVLDADTMQGVAQSVAFSFNKVLLATGTYTLVPAPAKAAQQRSTILVTRMLQAPFFCLVLTNLLFVVLGIALAVFALFIVSSKNARELSSIVSRLGVTALVADRFEGDRAAQHHGDIDDMFAESEGRDSVRIGISMTKEGGYSFSSWLPVQDTELTRISHYQAHADDPLDDSTQRGNSSTASS